MNYPEINPQKIPLPTLGEPYWDLIYQEVCSLPEKAATLVERLNAMPIQARHMPAHDYSLHTMLLMVQMGNIMRQAWDVMLPVPGQSSPIAGDMSRDSEQETEEFLRSILESLLIARSGLEQAEKTILGKIECH